MPATLSLKEVFAILRTGKWCSLTVITADNAKGKGGKVLHFPKCRIHSPALKSSSRTAKDSPAKAQRHYENITLNLQLPDEKQIRKIHPLLILELDGQITV